MKIVAARLDQFGAGWYRCTNPLTALQRLGHEVGILQAEQGLRIGNGQLFADLVFLQRQNDLGYYTLIDSLPEKARPKVVYEIDDLLWNFHGMMNPGAALEKDLQRTVPPMLARADAVICSTPELADECRKFNPNCHVLLNAVDYHLRDWTQRMEPFPAIGGRKVIGWSGGGWHDGDLQVMGTALRDVLRNHPDWCCLLQGDGFKCAEWAKSLKLSRNQTILADWMDYQDHPGIYSLFDIGIAPLAKNAYNRCKSELKLMELGAWGIPYVASDCSPYRRFSSKTQGVSGYLARNPAEWKQYLEYAIAEQDGPSRRLKSLTAENYSLEARAKEYEKVFYSIIGQERWAKTLTVG